MTTSWLIKSIYQRLGIIHSCNTSDSYVVLRSDSALVAWLLCKGGRLEADIQPLHLPRPFLNHKTFFHSILCFLSSHNFAHSIQYVITVVVSPGFIINSEPLMYRMVQYRPHLQLVGNPWSVRKSFCMVTQFINSMVSCSLPANSTHSTAVPGYPV